MKSKRTRRIALAVPSEVSFIERLLHGVADFAKEHGGWAFTRMPECMSPSFDWLRHWSGDGAFVMLMNQADARLARSLPMPVVNVASQVASGGVPTVTIDNKAIGHLAAEHLLSRQFRRFGWYGTGGFWSSQQRRAGFEEAIRAAGGKCDVLEMPIISPGRRRWDPGALKSWLRGLRPPVGIMASTDVCGSLIIEACAEAGLRVPEDVAIVGVDNDPVICAFCAPPLSSVARDDREIGRQAAALLNQLIEGAPPPKAPIFISSPGIAERRSTETLAIEDPHVAAAVQHIREHLHQVFGVEQLLGSGSLCRRRLEQRFQKSLGRTPYALINELRVQRAQQLLSEPRKQSLTQIAAACGFSELRRFRLVFRRLAKMTPAEYRRLQVPST